MVTVMFRESYQVREMDHDGESIKVWLWESKSVSLVNSQSYIQSEREKRDFGKMSGK